MKKINATKTVYCYYFPETRRIISELTQEYPHKVFLKSIKPGLDDFHVPVVEKYIKFHAKTLPKLSSFPHKYVTNGASEAIFHLLAKLKATEPETPIYVLKGEYQGYREYAKSLGTKVIEIDLKETNVKYLKPGIWFISNPSAVDGNIIPNKTIKEICQANHRMVLDITYVGLTKQYEFEAEHPNIIAVVSSMSKPFGLYYYRIGFTFTRKNIESLEGNIWFKNIFSLMIADRLLTELKPDYLYSKYSKIQNQVLDKINKEHGLSIKPSDVFILGTIDADSAENLSFVKQDEVEMFKRGDSYRFCLTPCFLENETNTEEDKK